MKFCTVFLMCIALTLGRVVKQNDKVENQVNQLSAVKNDPGIVNTNLRCHGTNNDCCTRDNPCGLGDGDCDNDYHCIGDLVCGNNNCPFSSDGDDCCMRPESMMSYPKAQCTVNAYGQFVGSFVPGDGEGAGWGYEEKDGKVANIAECVAKCQIKRRSDKSINGVTLTSDNVCYCEHNMFYISTAWGKGSYKTCYLPKYADIAKHPGEAGYWPGGWLGLRCSGHEDHCCTEKKPCTENEGDCDYDDQCYEPGKDLVCGNKNCAWGKDGDCCMQRHVGGDQVAEKPLLEEVKDEAPKFAPEEMTDAYV